MNLFAAWGQSTNATANDWGAAATSTTTNAAVLNVYNSVSDGGDFDLLQDGTNAVNTYAGTLVNGTTSGTITYSGTIGVGAIVASTISATAITATGGIDIGTSQAVVGTTALTVGDNNQTVNINSSDWDIDATGIATGMGNITSDGTVTVGVGFDATGAVDMDYGSGDITDHTFTSDGGTVILDGSVTASHATNPLLQFNQTTDATALVDANISVGCPTTGEVY
jgi:hypothetical protein